MVFEDIDFDVEENLESYPYDLTDLKIDIVQESKKMKFKSKKDGKDVTVAFAFTICKSFDYSNVLAVKDFESIDNMDSHDFFKNYLG